MFDLEREGVKRDAPFVPSRMHLAVSIVAEDGMTSVGQVHPDLMPLAGLEPHRQQG